MSVNMDCQSVDNMAGILKYTANSATLTMASMADALDPHSIETHPQCTVEILRKGFLGQAIFHGINRQATTEYNNQNEECIEQETSIFS